MPLKIHVQETKPGRFVVSLEGRLDTNTAPDLERKLAPVLETARTLVLDMAGLEYMSSIGLRVVMGARKTMHGRKGHVVLAHLQPQIERIFDLAEILPKTEIFNSVESADIFLEAVQRKELVKDSDVDA